MTTQRRVVCAAIRDAAGCLLLGIRHYSEDMHVQIANRWDGPGFKHRPDKDLGFVDQHGKWMSREEAYAVAAAARQIIDVDECPGQKLFSEGLY